mmetsp:Transcript_20462/g.27655  ORF Transcript_20462/g.27655 Transcript_20462/m.27655 type:complete len:184 (+) Transcript_20462:214-765(+)
MAYEGQLDKMSEIELARIRNKKPAIFDKLVLDPTSKPVAMFVVLIIIFSLISTLFGAFFACFGRPESSSIITFETVMEICFITDIVRNFFTQYFDPIDPRRKIRDLFKIAKHYLKGSFFLDVIACLAWPLSYVLQDSLEHDTLSLIFLLRLSRLGKIFILMNLQLFTSHMRGWFRGRLVKLIQ